MFGREEGWWSNHVPNESKQNLLSPFDNDGGGGGGDDMVSNGLVWHAFVWLQQEDSGYRWKSPAEKRHMHSSETANENFFFAFKVAEKDRSREELCVPLHNSLKLG